MWLRHLTWDGQVVGPNPSLGGGILPSVLMQSQVALQTQCHSLLREKTKRQTNKQKTTDGLSASFLCLAVFVCDIMK